MLLSDDAEATNCSLHLMLSFKVKIKLTTLMRQWWWYTTSCVCPSSVKIFSPVSMSQLLIKPSPLPENTMQGITSGGVYAQQYTTGVKRQKHSIYTLCHCHKSDKPSLCPVKINLQVPDTISHTLRVQSHDPVRAKAPPLNTKHCGVNTESMVNKLSYMGNLNVFGMPSKSMDKFSLVHVPNTYWAAY